MTARCELTAKVNNTVTMCFCVAQKGFQAEPAEENLVLDGKKVTMTISTQAIRTLKKKVF